MASTATDGDIRVHFQDRWDRLQNAMATEAIDTLIVAARGVVGGFGNVHYVCGHTPMIRPCYALLHASGEPTLFVPNASDREFALRRGAVTDVRNTGDMEVAGGRPAAPSIIEELEERSPRRVGIVGLSQVMPVADYLLFQRELPDVELVDASGLFAGVKQFKTEYDLAELRSGFALAQRGADVAPELLKPGVRAQEVIAAIEEVLRADTGMETLVFVDSSPHWARKVTDTVFSDGDLVMVLVEVATASGYFVEQGGLFSLGAPSAESRKVADACYETLSSIGEMIRPGTPVKALAAKHAEVARREGLDLTLALGHGVGVDHDLPTLAAGDEGECLEGQVISVHPYYTDSSRGISGGVAEGFHVTGDGSQQLSSLTYELTVL